MLDLLPATAVKVGESAADWRAAVRLAGEALVASGATSANYTDQMIETVEEMGPYIVIAPGIALAHSRPSEAVQRAGLSAIVLAHPVAFGHPDNDPVRLVVGLAAPDDTTHVTALATLADLLANDASREALLNAKSPEDVLATVRSWQARTVS